MNALERVSDPPWYQQSTQPYNSSLTASRTGQGCRVRKAYLSVGSALAHVPADKTVVSQAQTPTQHSTLYNGLQKLHRVMGFPLWMGVQSTLEIQFTVCSHQVELSSQNSYKSSAWR